MAEAYGTISYKNQRLINEDKAGRRVIGYEPQLINEGTAKFTLQGVGGMHGETLAGDSKSFNSLEEVAAAAGIDPSECQFDDMGDGTMECQVDEDNVIVMHSSAEEHSSVEIGGQTYTVGEQDPNDDGTIIEIKKHSNGYFITGGEYTDMQGEGSYADDRDNPKVGYGYALTLDGKPMEEDDLEDGLGHSEDAEAPLGARKVRGELLRVDHGYDIPESEDDSWFYILKDGSIKKAGKHSEDAESLEMVGWKELGLNFAVVRTMFEDESGQDVAGKYLDVASLKNMIANREDNMKQPGMRDAGMSGQLMKMSKQLSGLNDAVVVNFNKDIEDGEHEDAEKVDYGPSGEGKPVHPDEDAEGASPIQACMAAIDELAATLQGDDKLAVFEDLRDYLNAKLGQ